ncbi:MAG: hypothetical protein KC457_20955, partial [Myxococcales bacterium]|nr:hypothetical protein [Myxococcales bacterium]
TDSTPVKLTWGMYQGETLMSPTRGLFGRTMREELIVPLMNERHLELSNFAARYPTDEDEPPVDESTQAFASLRAYLLLAGDLRDYKSIGSDLEDQGKIQKEDAWLANQLTLWWSGALLVDGESDSYGKMDTMSKEYVKVLRERPELEIELDEKMVEDVRKVLRRSDRTEAALAELIRAAGETDGVKDVTLTTMKLGTNVYKNSGIRVRGAFTRQGWEKYTRAELAKPQGEFVGDEWVLGLTEAEAEARQMEDRLRLRSRYFDQYIKEWDQFVAKIYVDAESDLVGSLKMFQDLARGGTPLRVLLTNVRWHTTLEEEAREPGDVPWYSVDKLPPEVRKQVEAKTAEGAKAFYVNKDVKDYFTPFVGFGVADDDPGNPDDGPPQATGSLQIDAYAEQLNAVRDGLQAAIDDREELGNLAKKIKVATNVVKSQVSEQQEPWRTRFDNILRPPFDAVRGVVEGEGSKGVGGSWCTSVYQPWQEQIARKYPFNPKGYDLPLSDFTAWFGPDQGPVWDFYNNVLAGNIQRNGNSFSIVDKGKAVTVSYNAGLPGFLTEVADGGSVMFPPGSKDPKFEFEVQIDGTPGVSEITLTVDGAKVSYRNGPQIWQAMTWPGTEGDPGASIKAKGQGRNGDVTRSGDWGFWRLLGEATVSGSAGQQVYSIKWDLSDQQVGIITIRLRPKRGETPLFGVPTRGTSKYLGLFANMRVPRSVVSGYSCQSENDGGGGE